MGKRKPTVLPDVRASRPALTPEARERQLISLSYDLAEQRLRDGTATSAEVVHFLKLGSQRSKIELEKLALEKDLVVAKTEAYRAAENMEDMIKEAISAMKEYQGKSYVDDQDI